MVAFAGMVGVDVEGGCVWVCCIWDPEPPPPPGGGGGGGCLPAMTRGPCCPPSRLLDPSRSLLPLRVKDAHADAHGLKAHRGTGQPGKGIALPFFGLRAAGPPGARRPGDHDQALDQAASNCRTLAQAPASICRAFAGRTPGFRLSMTAPTSSNPPHP